MLDNFHGELFLNVLEIIRFFRIDGSARCA